MLTVIQIQEQAAQEAEAARDLLDKADSEARQMTAEEADQFDAHMKKSEQLEAQAARQERLEKAESRFQAQQPTASQPEIVPDGSRIETPNHGPRLYRYGTLQAFKGPNAQIEAYRSGRFLLATIFDHSSSRQWCHEHGIELRIEQEIDRRAMAEGINTAGGFIVPDEFETAIIDLREQYGIARQELRIQPMASDHSNQPKKTGGLTAYPVGENKAIIESEQGWGNVEMTARKWGVLTRISTEVSEDTIISLADDLAQDGSKAFATAEDKACIDGDGTRDYHGIIGIRTKMIDGNHAGSYYDVSTGCDEWSDLTEAHLLKLVGLLPQYADTNAKWHVSRVAKLAVLDRLARAAGGNTVIHMATELITSYMGYPIRVWPSMPSDDSSAALNNKIMLLFGDLRLSSKMGVRRGITIKRLEERYAEYDQIGIRLTERYDINHHSITGATPASDRGPIIGFYGGT